MNRRELLTRGSLAAAAMSIGQLSIPPESATSRRLKRNGPPSKVIVVGAGLAGLAAAYELARSGAARRIDVVAIGSEGDLSSDLPPERQLLADGFPKLPDDKSFDRSRLS
jgi:hypothetical protein